jgi:microcystin-dependent protein
LGTTYGGDGRTTFALPDLRGRVPLASGQGIGLTNRNVGDIGGEETHTLNTSEIPSHAHTIAVDTSIGTTEKPAGGVPARNAAGIPQYGTGLTGLMNVAAVAPTGGNGAHNNMQPFMTVTFIIALQGIFPSRN